MGPLPVLSTQHPGHLQVQLASGGSLRLRIAGELGLKPRPWEMAPLAAVQL
ncbi:hypothetical protein [Synechococcus sp. CBW1107]|uniref:hypothetical protein n=1 Tax=Synechococcus sp. CBW1107 TaxID=2789857 RepID=UPI002AD48022|nr:hypothetical protein [Synechococcus sp. CBW1107]MEA5423308.1 hypothetical protein [Synechococcus sp. CCY9202]